MAIATMDALIAGLKAPRAFQKGAFTGEAAGLWHNMMSIAGLPPAAVLAAPGLAGATVDVASGIGGMLPFANPAAGNAYLAKLSASLGTSMIGLMLFDLLWYDTGLAVATLTAQAINSVAWPARSIDGTVNGDGVQIWLYVSVATTNAGAIANTTCSYTSQGGVAGRVTGLELPWPATAVAGTMVPFALLGSDSGVRSLQSITLGTSYVAGTIHALALRPICTVMLPSTPGGVTLDAFALGMPQLFNSSALYLATLLSGTVAGGCSGELAYAHG